MNIIEVRDGFIKFAASEKICLASFILIEDVGKKYIAQVIQLKKGIESDTAYAKLLFIYDNNMFSVYDGTLPSVEASVTEFPAAKIIETIKKEEPVLAGKTLNGENIVLDSSVFDKKILVSVDNKKNNNVIVRNLVKQFNNLGKKVLVIDTYGVVDSKKYQAGVDFKLPLDTDTLTFMYKDCLNDVTSESKTTIVEIFKDLSDYSKTVPFLPFKALKTIIDDMVDKSHVFKLLVLKNKLAKFDRLGYFAADKREVATLSHILSKKCSVVDVSKLDVVFQAGFIEYIYNKAAQKNDLQIILHLSNSITKKSLKRILSVKEVPTAILTHSKFKYLNELKGLFDNFIIEPSLLNKEVFKIYGTFLRAMPENTALIVGEGSNYIPLITKISDIDEYISYDRHENDSDLEVLLKNNEASAEEIAENDSEIVKEQPEIINSINEKSVSVISAVANDLEVPETIELFNNNEESQVVEELTDEEREDAVESSIKDIIEIAPGESSEEISIEKLATDEDPVTELPVYDEQEEEIASEDYVEVSPEILLEEEETSVNVDDENADNISEDVLSVDENFETVAHQEFNEAFSEEEQQENSIELGSEFDLDIGTDSVEEGINDNIEHNAEYNSQYEDLEEIPVNEGYETAETINEVEEFGTVTESGSDDEIIELDADEATDEDIVVDMSDDFDEDEELSLESEKQIVKDVDKVFTTLPEESISESDLDLIDELNNDDEILEEVADDTLLEEVSEADDEIIEESLGQPIEEYEQPEAEILEKRDSSTPIVPVYSAEIPEEDLVSSDPVQQGDAVTHAKYGNGVVEKMIKYGSKTLYAINFENIGRRLLDPTLTEIKKS